MKPSPSKRFGFTLLELLVALAILVSVFAIIGRTLTTTLNAWKHGSKVLEELHHGDFVMEQMVSALRSTAFFETTPELYGFRVTKKTAGAYPGDRISWVTSSSAFMPLNSPYANGLHRLAVEIERTDQGEAAFAVRALAHLSEEEEDTVDPWLISSRVKGIRCRVYDEETSSWLDTWEETNAIPSLVEITLYIDSGADSATPLRIQRAVEIPVAPAVTGMVEFTEGED